MSSLMLTIREGMRYRGRGGHWSWIFHRLAGLGVLSFLVIHVWETAMANFNPPIYEFAIALFKHPAFGVGEIGLMAALLFHAFNGIRITILDFKPELWKHQKQSVTIVWVLFLVVFIPAGGYMFYSMVTHCSHAGAAACWALPTFGG